MHHVLCRRQNGQEGFVPANYVKEVEPLKTTKMVKKKEMVSIPVKVSSVYLHNTFMAHITINPC